MSKNSDGDKKKYKGFDENMFPEPDEKMNVGNDRPFTKYRAVEMALCLAAIVMGLLYLYTSAVTLGVLLPSFTAGMAVITLMRYLDAKKSGGRGFIAYIPTVFSALLTVLVAAVTVVYFRDMALAKTHELSAVMAQAIVELS